MTIEIQYPTGNDTIVLSSEIPILPVVLLGMSDFNYTGNEFVIEVRNYGFEGATDKVGEPVQIIDAAMLVGPMLAQVEAMNESVTQ